MAANNITSIALNGLIDMDYVDNKIANYEGLSNKTGLTAGNRLRPIYYKDIGNIYDNSGDINKIFYYNNNWVYSKGSTLYYGDKNIGDIETTYYVREKLSTKKFSWNNMADIQINKSNVSLTFDGNTYTLPVVNTESTTCAIVGGVFYITCWYGKSIATYSITNGTLSSVDTKQCVVDRSLRTFTSTTNCSHWWEIGTSTNGYSFSAGGSSTEFSASNVLASWNRGYAVSLGVNNFCILYYNHIPEAISYNGSKIINNIGSIITYDASSIIYEDTEGGIYKLYKGNTGIVQTIGKSIKEKYICFNTTSYNNTLNLETMELFCRSDDYNDRLLPIANNSSDKSGTSYYATGVNEQVIAKSFNWFASIYSEGSINSTSAASTISFAIAGGHASKDINIYMAASNGITPTYFKTWNNGSIRYDYNLDGFAYPQPTDNNNLMNCCVLDTTVDTYLNTALFVSTNSSYLAAIDTYQNMIFGYYDDSYTTLDSVFAINGSYYGIGNDKLYSFSYDSGALNEFKVVADAKGLQYIGSTTQMALFYSSLTRIIYSFTGSNTFNDFIDCPRITEINNFYCSPSENLVVISTNDGVYIIKGTELSRLDGIDMTNIEITKDTNGIVIGEKEISLYSGNGFMPLPLKVETDFYGAGGMIKSTNDCVYIRLCEPNSDNSYLKIASYSLDGKLIKQEPKEMKINKAMLSNDSIYIKYQPKNQECLGFKLAIETDMAIQDLFISHAPTSIENTMYCL